MANVFEAVVSAILVEPESFSLMLSISSLMLRRSDELAHFSGQLMVFLEPGELPVISSNHSAGFSVLPHALAPWF